jgi:hypothetical protein
MKREKPFRILLHSLVLSALVLSSCERIDLIAFTLGIPLKEDFSWGAFKMVIAPGSEGAWDTSGATDGAVILDGDMYRIWYAGSDGSNLRIISAESADGKIWGNFQQNLDVGNIPGVDDLSIHFPAVLKTGATYQMWYTGSTSSDLTKLVIIYCDSNRLDPWTNFHVAVDAGSQGTYDTGAAWGPTVILDDGIYKMWYAGYADGNMTDRIIYCESLDGITWGNFHLAIGAGNLGGYDDLASNSPSVIKDAGIYKMWYSGQAQAGSGFSISTIYCESTDGISWENFRLVMEAGAQGEYDSAFVTGPMVINNNGTGMMWYRGKSAVHGNALIYCESQ